MIVLKSKNLTVFPINSFFAFIRNKEMCFVFNSISIDFRINKEMYFVFNLINFCRRCKVNDSWDVHNGRATAGNQTTKRVEGLLPYTPYSFRVVAVNGMGQSKPSVASYCSVTLRESEYRQGMASGTVVTGNHFQGQ